MALSSGHHAKGLAVAYACYGMRVCSHALARRSVKEPVRYGRVGPHRPPVDDSQLRPHRCRGPHGASTEALCEPTRPSRTAFFTGQCAGARLRMIKPLCGYATGRIIEDRHTTHSCHQHALIRGHSTFRRRRRRSARASSQRSTGSARRAPPAASQAGPPAALAAARRSSRSDAARSMRAGGTGMM